MKTKKRLLIPAIIIFAMGLLISGFHSGSALAGVPDVLLGFRFVDQQKNDALGLSELPDDWSTINSSNFSTYFTASTITISGESSDVQIGAIWTATCDPNNDLNGCWREMRIAVDSDGTPGLDPFNWDDPTHPWNMTSGIWSYPADYPGIPYDNGNNDGTIDFDAGESFPWDNFQWWWYESQYDFTQQWWMQQGELMLAWWSGRDANWNVLPNGTYDVNVAVNEIVDTTFDLSTEANKWLSIKIETASITGTVKDAAGNPIAGARVDAGSNLAWGEARTRADGTFTVSGLEAGATYYVRVQAEGKVTAELDVNLPAGETTASAGTITLQNAVSITGALKLDRDGDGTPGEDPDDKFVAFTNQWGWEQYDLPVWVDAWNKQGPGWGNAEARFKDASHPEYTSGDDISVTFTINIPPPSGSTIYQVNFHAEGYAASPVDVAVDSTGGIIADPIVLTKASIVTGSVQLPSAISEWTNIDVQAINATNIDDRYWGWGWVDGSQTATDTGAFRLDGVPEGTYNLEVRVWGYAMASQQITVTKGQDLAVPTISISEGSKIIGTLVIQGDTSTVQRWEGDTEDPIHIWIDAWSPTAGWGGTDVTVARSTTDTSTSYSIGGLSSGTYEIHCWLGEGYELVDDQGNSPVMVTLASDAQKNLVLKPFEGIITGTISGDGVTVDLSKVVVEAKRPWDWLPPRIATVANGGINASTGAYSVSGLGTDDYVVKGGMYIGWLPFGGGDPSSPNSLDTYLGDGFLVPDTTVGTVMERVFVENDTANPTTLDITFEKGYSIAGTISLSTSDPPWHDANDDGRKDPEEVITIPLDVAGQMVMAMPMDMMFMGGSDPRMGVIQANRTYQINGLAPGVYIIMPPASSRRPLFAEVFQGGFFEGGEQTHHWTTRPRMVVITDGDVSGVNFTFGNGYSISGRVTLPEAQTSTQDWETWWWVGHLELETPDHSFLGHGRPLFKGDFNNSSSYDFTFHHVANGAYLIRFWTDRYVPGGAKVTVNGANVTTNLTIEKGANLVGKLVDADTGEAVTSADGVRVYCEAYPWVEGSWRETRDDMWSLSYIENDSGLMTGDVGGTGGARENKTPGKFHLTALPTGHKYVVVVETSASGDKTGGAKNYVGRVIAGIDIPEEATGDFDIGTIKLKEGTTIKGRLTDPNGNGIPGVEVFAMPSDTHDGTAEAEGISDTSGYYTVYGVNPNVEYYDLIAAERPFLFEDWGRKVEWGEKRMYNVPPGTTDANFTLVRATATLSGTVTIPAGSEFMLPFKGEGEVFPATYLLLQRRGVVYKDVLDGAEGMTMPAPSGVTTSSYTVDNLEPGDYRMFAMNYGLPTQVLNVTLADGGNTLDVTWTSAGYAISGGCALSTGGYPSSSDISGVVCMNVSNQSLIFGQLTAEADNTYPAYEVPGLADGQTYQLAFYRDSGMDEMPDVYPAGNAVTVDSADISYDVTISRSLVPILMVQAVQDPNDSSNILLGIFSTTYLVDQDVSVVTTAPTVDSTAGELFISSGNGSLADPVLSGDKRTITTTYRKDADDGDVALILAVHYGDDATLKLQTISFNVNTVATNGNVLNIYMAGLVKLGNGDGSQMFIPAGAFETTDRANALGTIEMSTEEPGALALSRAPLSEARKRGAFARSALVALPSGVTPAGNQYNFNVAAANEGATVAQRAAVTLQIEYDPNKVSSTNDLNVWHLVGSTWTKETTSRTVDTGNNTIAIEATSLSPFIAALGELETPEEEPTPTPAPAGGGGGGGCFVATAAHGSSSVAQHMFIVLTVVVIGLSMVRLRAKR